MQDPPCFHISKLPNSLRPLLRPSTSPCPTTSPAPRHGHARTTYGSLGFPQQAGNKRHSCARGKTQTLHVTLRWLKGVNVCIYASRMECLGCSENDQTSIFSPWIHGTLPPAAHPSPSAPPSLRGAAPPSRSAAASSRAARRAPAAPLRGPAARGPV